MQYKKQSTKQQVEHCNIITVILNYHKVPFKSFSLQFDWLIRVEYSIESDLINLLNCVLNMFFLVDIVFWIFISDSPLRSPETWSFCWRRWVIIIHNSMLKMSYNCSYLILWSSTVVGDDDVKVIVNISYFYLAWCTKIKN